MVTSKIFEHNDSDIYDSIINEYDIDTTNIDLIRDIYLCKKEINKSKCNIKKNINNINKLKLDFLQSVSKWKLADSCNKNKVKLQVLNINKTHEIISHLQYLNEDLVNIINSYTTKINTLLTNKDNKYISIKVKDETTNTKTHETTNIVKDNNTIINNVNMQNEYDIEIEDCFNSIINY